METDQLLTETERNMREAGVNPSEPAYEDYFGFEETQKWWFPDNIQYIEFKLMNEGARSRYQSKTSRDIRLFKTSGDASVKMDPSSERKILFEESVIGWYVLQNGKNGTGPAAFGSGARPGSPFQQWMEGANPKYVSSLETAIRKANVWMGNEMTVELIDEEIKNLQSLREEAVKREEGKAVS